MPEKMIDLDCCVLFLSEYPEHFFSLELGEHNAAYIRVYNPEKELNSLEYFNLKTIESCVVCTEYEQLQEFDQRFKYSASQRRPTLSKNELHLIFSITGHVHTLAGMNHPSQALIQARYKGERLSGYDEIMVQMYERRMLLRSSNTDKGFSRSFIQRVLLLDLAIKSENHKSLHELLFHWDTTAYDDICQMMNKVVSRCIASKKRHMLRPIVQYMLASFWDKRPDYNQLSNMFERFVKQIRCDEAAFYRVKPIFALLDQLYKDVRESRFNLGKSRYHAVRQFQAAVEQQLITFLIDIFQPLDDDSSPIHMFTEECAIKLAALEQAVPSAAYLQLPANRNAYQGFREFFNTLKQQKLPSSDSVYSFFNATEDNTSREYSRNSVSP